MRRAAAALGLLLASLAAGCGKSSAPSPDAAAPSADIPPPLQACAGCHAKQVREFMGHGMSRSLGPLGEPPTGAWTNYGPALHAPIGPLHWAGAEYAQVWNGYMDGAVRSGEATAAEVIELM